MANSLPNPYSSWANRKAKQDFKRRYNRLSDNEKAAFNKGVNNTGCIVASIIFFVFVLIIILKALLL